LAFYDTIFQNSASLLLAGLGDSVKHYPAGDSSLEESVTALVSLNALDQPSGGDGDGTNLTNERGTRIRQTGFLDLLPDVEVSEESTNQKASVFLIDDSLWICKRITGKESAFQTVEIVRVDQKSTRRTQRT
jgi:hypothetical protein